MLAEATTYRWADRLALQLMPADLALYAWLHLLTLHKDHPLLEQFQPMCYYLS